MSDKSKDSFELQWLKDEILGQLANPLRFKFKQIQMVLYLPNPTEEASFSNFFGYSLVVFVP